MSSKRSNQGVLRVQLGHLALTFVFRHKWDRPGSMWTQEFEYRTKTLGVFFKSSRAVGTYKVGRDMFSPGNLGRSWMLGLNLIVAKCWVDVSWRVKHFKLED